MPSETIVRALLSSVAEGEWCFAYCNLLYYIIYYVSPVLLPAQRTSDLVVLYRYSALLFDEDFLYLDMIFNV